MTGAFALAVMLLEVGDTFPMRASLATSLVGSVQVITCGGFT